MGERENDEAIENGEDEQWPRELRDVECSEIAPLSLLEPFVVPFALFNLFLRPATLDNRRNSPLRPPALGLADRRLRHHLQPPHNSARLTPSPTRARHGGLSAAFAEQAAA